MIEFHQIFLCIYIDKIYVRNVNHHFWHICHRVMALDLCQNFVSAQYFINKWTEFDQILHLRLYLKLLFVSFLICNRVVALDRRHYFVSAQNILN